MLRAVQATCGTERCTGDISVSKQTCSRRKAGARCAEDSGTAGGGRHVKTEEPVAARSGAARFENGTLSKRLSIEASVA